MTQTSRSNFQIKAGATLGYVNYALKMGVQLLYVPILLRLLGQNEYGIYQLVASVISYLGLLNFGFGGAYLRFYAQCRGDIKKEGQLNGTYLLIFCFFALLAGIAGTLLTAYSDAILGSKLSTNELGLAKVLLGIMTLNMVITFPSSVFSAIVSSKEQFVFLRLVEMLQTLFNPFLTILLLLLGYGAVGVVCVGTVLSVIGFAANLLFVHFRIKAPFSFRSFHFSLVREIGAFSFFLFLNSVIDQINWNVDKFLLGRFVGAAAIAVYSVGAQINNIYVQLADMMATVFAPRVNQIAANEQTPMTMLNALFIKVGRLQSLIVFAVVSGFTLFGKAFITLWAGPEYEEAYYVTLLLIIPISIPLCQTLGVDIQRALNKHQYRSVIYALMSVANLGISIPLAKLFGAIGAALGTTISLLVCNGLIMNILYHKVVGLDVLAFWSKILRLLPTIIPPCIITSVIKKIVPMESWGMLVLEIANFVVIYIVCICLFGLNEAEKKQAKKAIVQLKRKICDEPRSSFGVQNDPEEDA